ncbi:Chaperone protein DnaJ [Sarcoptes scabiei]|uniref:Chaperone protein DnaJ n=1 Tax=Sarcoptes scabiei TaxID=52283 RepID=A0A834VBM6_SARSC|nr:Chaperone protein DnaJ [Sarcoptes scabiei]
MEPENLYSILGLSEKSNPEEIKNSYRKLALKYHPDKQQGTESDQLDENRMKSINYAAKILIDPSKDFVTIHHFLANDDNYCYDCRCGGRYIFDFNQSGKQANQSNSISDPNSNKKDNSESIKLIVIDCDCCSLSVQLQLENR